jgi:hypothetical protein
LSPVQYSVDYLCYMQPIHDGHVYQPDFQDLSGALRHQNAVHSRNLAIRRGAYVRVLSTIPVILSKVHKLGWGS